jgi:hypothetical protein
VKIPESEMEHIRQCLHSQLLPTERPLRDGHPNYRCQKDVPQTAPETAAGPPCVLLNALGREGCPAWEQSPTKWDPY